MIEDSLISLKSETGTSRLTPAEWDRLLGLLDPDPEKAASAYLILHLKLVKLFAWEGVLYVEALADDRFHDQRERIGACRNADKVDVVGHEAIGQYIETMLDRVLQEPLQISPAVVVAEEDIIASIAALGDVMGETRDDYSGDPWHAAILLPSSGQSQDKQGSVPYFTIQRRRRFV